MPGETRSTDTSFSTATNTRQGSTVNETGDASHNTLTPYTIALGDRFAGSLSSINDEDWVEVSLNANEEYVFSVWGINGIYDGLNNPALTLYDDSGTEVAFNEDADADHGVYFPLIEYRSPTSGTYYLEVASNSSETGDYILQATTDVLSIHQVATQLVEFGWGNPTPFHHDKAPGDTITINIVALNAEGEKLSLWAMESWGETLGIDFVTTTSRYADIIFDDSEDGAFAGFLSYNPDTGIINQSFVNIGTDWLSAYGTTYDSYSFQTYLHEVGHALGLAHSGNYDGFAQYGTDNFYENDSYQITVMSYFGIGEAGLGDDAIVVTPMVADVYAVWGLYGEPISVNAGDTVWGANSNVIGTLGTILGYIFDDDAIDEDLYRGDAIALTITDTDGQDLLDLSPVTSDQLIDLNEGAVSNIGGKAGNMVISLGSIIEDVIGGAGDDEIRGNDTDNTISGGGGEDIVYGGGGNDTVLIEAEYANATIVVQSGADVFISWATDQSGQYNGIEHFTFLDRTLDLSDLAADGSNSGGINGTDQNDLLLGTAGNDVINGFGNNDRIEGGPGNDTLIGGDGNDGLLGQDGDDYLEGGKGNDRLPGAAGSDTIYGGSGNDALGGSDGDDLMYGGDGDDRHGGGNGSDIIYGGTGNDGISGGAQRDWLYGGEGSDRVAGSFGSDETYGGDGNDRMGGGFGNDLIFGGSGNDTVGAGQGNDTVYGETGADLLNSGDGDDVIYGGNDDDRINSGNGDDVMTGGDGADIFVFTNPTTNALDTITDFEISIDTLALDRVGGNGDQGKFNNLHISQARADTTIEWRDHMIVLQNTIAADLTAEDFEFI